MNITRFAIERRRVTMVLLAILAFAGLQSYQGMPKAEDPGFLIRTAVVITQFPGASPQRVEELVTDPIETAVQEMPELDVVYSTSKNGVSLVSIDVKESYTNLRPIWDSLRRKVDSVADRLPEGVIGPNVDDEFGDVFGTVLSLRGDGYSDAELADVADQVRDELLLVPDVAKVEIYGEQEERIFIEYENAQLAELGLSPDLLQQALQGRNIINPGGQVTLDQDEIVIEPSGNLESLDDLGSVLVPTPGGDLVSLRDIVEIRRGTIDPPRVRTHVDGERGMALAVSVREGGNVIDVGAAVRVAVERLRQDLPIGIDLEIPLEQSLIVQNKVSDFVGNLAQAVAIVMVVMLISLGLRTGLVVASLIPMAILVTFLVMPLTGTGIDQMSLAALIIALGLLVDNAIVMSESTLVQMQEGKTATEAALASARELRASLLISSLTTAAAFLPIFLAQSAVGEYTGALFKVVTTTLLVSWVLALTMIPLLCVLFLRVRGKSTEDDASFDTPLYRGYRSALRWVLQHRLVSIVAVALAFFGSFVIFGWVPKIFFPDNDRPTFSAKLEMPVGTPLERTEEVVWEVERFILDNLMSEEPGKGPILDTLTFVGDSPPMFVLGFTGSQVSPEAAVLVGNGTDRETMDVALERIREFAAGIPGLQATIEPLGMGPGGGKPIEVRVSGRDLDDIFARVGEVKDKLVTLPGTRNVADDWGARTKKFRVDIDEDRARRAGVNNQDVAKSLRTTFSGLEVTQFREGDKVIPVVLRSGQAKRDDIGSLNVFTANGTSVPLFQVGNVELDFQPAKILRRNRLRTVTVQSDLAPGVTAAEVNAQLQPYLEDASQSWPLGTSWEIGGEDEDSAEASASIAAQLPLAGMAIVLLLVWQFDSLRKPAIILATIPLAFIGVFLGLWIMRSYFGFMTLLGVISLAGIVINNAIVLIDRVQLEIDNGRAAYDALVEAGQRRLRPILLTTFTTLGGMIPLYLGGGPMFEPMAVAIMFGLLFATCLTLGFVPLLYSVFYRVRVPAS